MASPFEPPNYLYNASVPQVRSFFSSSCFPWLTLVDQTAYDTLVSAANCTSASDSLDCLRKTDAKLLTVAAYLDTFQGPKG